MKIELKRKEEITGDVRYNIYVNDSCELSFGDEVIARKRFSEMKERAKEEFPKVTLLDSYSNDLTCLPDGQGLLEK